MTENAAKLKLPSAVYLVLVGIAGWWVPGAGHWIVGRPKRAAVIFLSITFAFVFGIWIGSIGVVDSSTPWYWAQILNSPAVAYVGHLAKNVCHIDSYGRTREIGEIYTAIAGMLNLLCVVNAVYMAHCNSLKGLRK